MDRNAIQGSPSADVQRAVYVVLPDSASRPDEELDIRELWATLLRGKWVILITTVVFVVATVVYALTAREWYRAKVLLIAAESQSTSGLGNQLGALGALGGLATLAGINVGSTDTAEPLAVLTSQGFTRAFIEEQKLLPVLFADEWDAKAGGWKDPDPEDQPDIHDAVKYFEEDIRSVSEDKKTKLVTVTVEWTDREVAAKWANLLVARLNAQMRQRALHEAESNVNYLKRELETANIVTLQQSIGRLLDSELQKAMLARVNEEFSFKILDRASPPKWRSWPKRAQLVALSAVLGVFFSCLFLLLRRMVGKGNPAASS